MQYLYLDQDMRLEEATELLEGGIRLGEQAHLRAGSVLYCGLDLGAHFQTGHHVTLRGPLQAGAHVSIGTSCVLEGHIEIGNRVKIASQCVLGSHTRIGSRVFIGPGVMMTNDRLPLKQRDRYRPEGPHLEDGVTIGAGSVLLPGIMIGKGSFVAAGSVVVKDVPPDMLAKGNPARFEPLPDHLKEDNQALSWPDPDSA
ncbi:N-acetyltransferase [Hyphobacterium sp. CCMP332]|uniref:acyltransferase n=1 Tax=Hyphobacterium sp. CCMP332 TaxID=2749086 RepID=UPI0016509FD5|nr:acyltransferase [Hyphobacterium sp. CCMP332]QNL17870.1 N-acetyltransferase [Hyphobacterium sp. CCMP332]